MEQKKKPRYNMWQNSGFMIARAWEQRKMVLLLCVAEAIIVIGLSLVKLLVTPSLLAAVESHVNLQQLIMMIVGFTGLLILFQALERYVAGIQVYGRIEVRSYLVRKICQKRQETSYSNLEKEEFNTAFAKASEATGGNDDATEAVWKTLTSLLKNFGGFVVYLLLLTRVNIYLILLVLATTIAGYFFSKKITTYEYRHREEDLQYDREMWYLLGITQDQKGAKDIRIFGLRHWLREVMNKILRCDEAFHRKAAGIYIWSNIIDLILAFLRNGAAYAYLVVQVVNGNLSVSEFLLYFSAVDGFTVWITGILENMLTLHQQSLDIDIVREFLETPEPFEFENGKSLNPSIKQSYEIKLENVSFRYPGAEQDTLSHINLTLHPGEKLAIVGVNGAGKTTLVKLLCGFYDPTEGRVLLNGEDIRTFNRNDYYRMFTAVFQDFFVLAGSITLNVAQSEQNVDMERVKRCIADAGLTEKIESLPQQYDTLLERSVYEDAVMLSGGEMQRLMLARALYKNGPVVVLDEPTAALDPLAEADLYQKYHEMTKERSSIYISHRLASTRFCDRTILIEDGKIIEEGTHEELLQKGEQYSEMFAVQSKYYQ